MTHRALFGLVIVLGTMLLLSGCRDQSADSNPTEPDLLATLPAEWVVVPVDGNTWTQVNIDNDEEAVEFFLLYTYDNQVAGTASGPAGSSIFDLQDNTEFAPSARVFAMPYQPSGTYVPYRILPNYWQGSATGFIAPTGRQDKVTVTTIDRDQYRKAVVSVATPSVDSIKDNDLTIANDVDIEKVQVRELLIEDGGQTITIVWWRNLIEGYGVANAHAASGFQNRVYEQEGEADTPLNAFDGYHPFNDRSELCHVTTYTRQYLTKTIILDSTETVVPTVNFTFEESPHGIRFCDKSVPATPFYPEAVVLRYLLYAELDKASLALDDEPWSKVANELAAAIREETKRIQGLFGPNLIPFDSLDDSAATVCLSVVDESSGREEAYTFHLNHVRPDVEARTTDQFKIVNVQLLRAPSGGPAVDCNDIVEDGTPGSVPSP